MREDEKWGNDALHSTTTITVMRAFFACNGERTGHFHFLLLWTVIIKMIITVLDGAGY